MTSETKQIADADRLQGRFYVDKRCTERRLIFVGYVQALFINYQSRMTGWLTVIERELKSSEEVYPYLSLGGLPEKGTN